MSQTLPIEHSSAQHLRLSGKGSACYEKTQKLAVASCHPGADNDSIADYADSEP